MSYISIDSRWLTGAGWLHTHRGRTATCFDLSYLKLPSDSPKTFDGGLNENYESFGPTLPRGHDLAGAIQSHVWQRTITYRRGIEPDPLGPARRHLRDGA